MIPSAVFTRSRSSRTVNGLTMSWFTPAAIWPADFAVRRLDVIYPQLGHGTLYEEKPALIAEVATDHVEVRQVRRALDEQIPLPDEEVLRQIVAEGGLQGERTVLADLQGIRGRHGADVVAAVLHNAHALNLLDHERRMRCVNDLPDWGESLVDQAQKVALRLRAERQCGLVEQDHHVVAVLELTEGREEATLRALVT
jgi:hypothetical protein